MAGEMIKVSDLQGEPFRLFFPLGWLAGVFAVAMWPLYFADVYPFYPGMAHARLMILGFIGAFVVGFLGTALPRMLEVPAFGRWELWGFALLWLAGVTAYTGLWLKAGDAFFLALFAGFMLALARRFPLRKDLPPPAFVLVLWGFAHLFAGLLLLLATPAFGWGSAWSRLGADFLYQGFLLCPLLGIGTFLFPRLLGYAPMKVTFPGNPEPTPEWRRRAWLMFLAGLLIFTGFWVEAWLHARAGAWLRAATVLVFLILTVPFWKKNHAGGWYPLAVRAGLWGLAAGLLLFPLAASWRLPGLHLAFMAGFSMLTLLVATRVLYGHGGEIERFQAALPWAGLMLALTLGAIAARVGADFRPENYIALIWVSALLWIVAALVWAVRVLIFVPFKEIENEND